MDHVSTKGNNNEAKMLFTPTLETNDSKSHELAQELVYSFLSIHFSSYTVLKVVFLVDSLSSIKLKILHFSFILKCNRCYFNSISQTINAVSKS